MYELKIFRDYRDGKVTKEELDKCSTCDMNCVINNGLSEASKEQLKRGCGRFLGPELSNSKTASILHRTQPPPNDSLILLSLYHCIYWFIMLINSSTEILSHFSP